MNIIDIKMMYISHSDINIGTQCVSDDWDPPFNNIEDIT